MHTPVALDQLALHGFFSSWHFVSQIFMADIIWSFVHTFPLSFIFYTKWMSMPWLMMLALIVMFFMRRCRIPWATLDNCLVLPFCGSISLSVAHPSIVLLLESPMFQNTILYPLSYNKENYDFFFYLFENRFLGAHYRTQKSILTHKLCSFRRMDTGKAKSVRTTQYNPSLYQHALVY